MLTEKSFRCPACGEIIDFDRLWPSIKEFGFINLFSENEEIFAANCPRQECASLCVMNFETGGADAIHQELNDILDPHGYQEVNGRFDYYSSMPFSFQAHGILKSFSPIEINSKDIEHPEFALVQF